MNRFLSILLLCFTFGVAHAATNMLVNMRDEGPCVYEDGTLVSPGERFVAVLVNSGVDFAGLRSDGTLVDEENCVLLGDDAWKDEPRANEEGGCFWLNDNLTYKSTTITVDYAMYGGYTLYVLMLDTRTPSGTVGGSIVNGYGVVGSCTVQKSIRPGSIVIQKKESLEPTTRASTRTESPANLPAPFIAGITVDGTTATLLVTNTVAGVYYLPTATAVLGTAFAPLRPLALPGASDPDEPLTFTVPLDTDSSSAFYKVVGGTYFDFQ